MSFPSEITNATLGELLKRKELFSLVAGPHRVAADGHERVIPPSDHLRINSYQLFIKNLVNPNTPYRKIHLAWAPGSGKTVGALVAANEFIGAYRQLYAAETMVRARFRAGRAAAELADVRTPSVFVLGFTATETAFVRDLLGYSYFGFVSHEEREELNFRKQAASSGSESDIKALNEYESRLRRRITDKSRGGFFKFLGYEKFVNRLFSSTGVDFVQLEKETHDRMRTEPDITLQDVIDEYIAAGKVAVNTELLARLENSLLICDEIHDTYNKTMKNNRGVAVQYVLNKVKTLRFISMSATPINNSPVEVVDFANYFIDNRADQLRRRDLFDGRKLRPGALDRIRAIMFGKISFVQDTDTRYYPTSEMVGEPLIFTRATNGFAVGTALPYLKFLQAPMTAAQLETVDAYLSEHKHAAHADVEEDEVGFPLPADGFTVYDMVFPIPGGYSFRSGQIKHAIDTAPAQWRKEIGIGIAHTGNVTAINGDFLRRENIEKYSSKYALLLDDLDALYKKGPSKCLIYHFRVEMSGAVFIGELLKMNGYIEETGNATANTRCVHCGLPMQAHTEQGNGAPHIFAPVRFILAHHNVANLRASIEKYRAPDNADGSKFAILIGSEIIKQAYDFKCVQTLYTLSLSTSIEILIQIYGRAIRKESHSLLPPDKRHVQIKNILQVRSDGQLSPEVLRYASKMEDHLTTQLIMRELISGAPDANINRAINMSPALLKEYFPNGDMSGPSVPRIDTLYFTPSSEMPVGPPTTVTYYAHGHYRRDIEDIVGIVKIAFMRRSVWTRGDLYKYVSDPLNQPYGVEVDPRGFTPAIFAVAMRYLTAHQYGSTSSHGGNAEHNIFDFVSKYVYVNGVKCTVSSVAEYYIAIQARHIASESSAIDAETYMRLPPTRNGVMLQLADVDGSIDMQFKRAIATWADATSPNDFLTSISTEMQIAIVREIIESGYGNGKITIPRADDIVRLIQGFGAAISFTQVMLFTDVADIFGTANKPLSEDNIVGYTEARSIQLYNGVKWMTIKKTMMNKQIEYREPDGYIGVLETVGTRTKLKIRQSLEEIRGRVNKNASDGFVDTRLVDRGMACETKSRQQLDDIVARLGGKLSDNNKIRGICDHIRDRLVILETAERRKKTKTKYLYGWWDEQIDVKNIIAKHIIR